MILVTGAGGFLGHALVEELLGRGQNLLLLSRSNHALPGSYGGRVEWIRGDIEVPALGISGEVWARWGPEIQRIIHLAALFDVKGKRDRLERTNVEGTRHVFEMALRLPNLKGFCHVSTAYVCGRFQGVFRGEDLSVGQSFRNGYEQTKYSAERFLRECAPHFPVTVIRPSMVVDDLGKPRHTRAGAYRLIDLALRWGLLPVVGTAGAPFNVVPLSFVAKGIAELATHPDPPGGTYHLCDPSPTSSFEFCRLVAKVCGRRCAVLPLRGALPMQMLKGTRTKIPWVDALDALNTWPAFDTSRATRTLQSAGICCPRISSYLPAVVRYYREAAHC